MVLGNPPYSGHSANASYRVVDQWVRKTPQDKGRFVKKKVLTWIGQLIEEYKKGCPELHKPAQAKWLHDDYVKFIRWGQWRIEQTGAGVLSFVTNHAYLDNPTFRGMRMSLKRTFNDIRILDLHGSTKKKETTPRGGKDENVRDCSGSAGTMASAASLSPLGWPSASHSARRRRGPGGIAILRS